MPGWVECTPLMPIVLANPMRIFGLLLSLSLLGSSLFSQPLPPTRPLPAPSGYSLGGAQALSIPLSVDISTRAASRQFYHSVYYSSEGFPIQWTGNYTTGVAGTTSSSFKDSVALRINWYRAMAGIPAGITFNDTYSAKAQQAALMMSVNNQLSHTPPTSWTFYTLEGAEAASNSNLTLGYAGPDSVTALISDEGSNNSAAGHRRWFLYPQTQVMGTGDVPGNATYSPAQAVWVFDNYFGTTRPATRDSFVAWPPKGYVPYNQIFARWSFSYPAADFTHATLSVTKNGAPVTVSKELIASGYGENTLVWFVDGVLSRPLSRPAADIPYVVSLNNVSIGGFSQNFNYTVTAFDPDIQGTGESLVTVTGPSTIGLSQGTPFALNGPAYADSLQWRILTTASQSAVLGAEGGLQSLVPVIDPSYSARVTSPVRSGTGAYYLAQPLGASQYLTLPDSYYVPASGGPTFNFYSRLGYASSQQGAHVQISLDDGLSWADVWTQVGTDGAGETAYALKSIPLAPYAGRTLRFRFTFDFLGNGSYYPQTSTNVGWLIDDITLPNVQLATLLSTAQSATGATFTVTPTTKGTFMLQGRGLFAGKYQMEWGLVKSVSVADSSHLVNVSVRANSRSASTPLTVGFTVVGGPRTILVRGIGPTLKGFGVPTAVDDSILKLFQTVNNVPTLLDTNDNWSSSNTVALQTAFATTYAFPLTVGSLDSAMLATVEGSRTAQCYDASKSGIVLVEAYDTLTNEAGHLVNLSARNYAGTGNDVLTAGFSIQGNSPMTLLIRAVGSELSGFGVPGAIANPTLDLYKMVGETSTLVASNDDWDSTDLAAKQVAFSATYAFPLSAGSKSSCLIITLEPGLYTAQLKGVNNATGEGLVEVYVMP